MALGDRPVSEVMQTEIASLEKADRLDLAEDIMRLGRVRHLPVLDEGRVVGLVSHRDLLAASLSKILDFDPQERRSFVRSVEVGEVMARDLCTVEPDAPLRDAASRMLRRKIGCLPVVKPDGTLVGLLTETDLVRVAFLSDPPADLSETPGEAPDAREDAHDSGSDRDSIDVVVRWVETEFDSLRRARDELRVQAHLAKAEARDAWQELEHKLREAESKVKLVLGEAEGPAEDLREAVGQLLGELKAGYRRLRDSL